MMKIFTVLIAAVGALVGSVMHGATVGVEAGNVVLVGGNGQRSQLTGSGLDAEPALSPDGAWVVFVRRTPSVLIEAGSGNVSANEIWLVEASGKNPRRLVQGKSSPDMKQVLAGLSQPLFSVDSKGIYFLSVAWVTSNAVHRVNRTTGNIEYVAAGNSLEVVRGGKYAGALIVQQHRYWLAGGSYDWYWLLDAEGKEVGPIGDENGLLNFREMFGQRAPGESRD